MIIWKAHPELIVEIAASSASHDLHEKMKVYRRNGVQEYIVWQTFEGRIDWFSLEAEQYVPLQSGAEGIVHSRVFPGLCLDLEAMITGDLAKVLAGLQQCMRTAVRPSS